MKIPDIKTQLSIITVLNHYGVKIDKNNKGNCPFHKDKTPSFQVYPISNTYCCFSSNCEAGTGDQIQFIELMEKQGKHQAILKAKELLGVVLTKTASLKTAESTASENPNPELENLNEVYKKLKQNLGKSTRAKEYLASRNLLSDQLDVGFNATAYKDLKNCIVFPLRDKNNNVVSLYGRSINGTTTNKHYYTKNRQGLYPKYPSKKTKRIILTESIIDAQTLLQQEEITSKYEVLALYGTNGLTLEHTEVLGSLAHLEEVVLWFDGDEAGEKATSTYKEMLFEQLKN